MIYFKYLIKTILSNISPNEKYTGTKISYVITFDYYLYGNSLIIFSDNKGKYIPGNYLPTLPLLCYNY